MKRYLIEVQWGLQAQDRPCTVEAEDEVDAVLRFESAINEADPEFLLPRPAPPLAANGVSILALDPVGITPFEEDAARLPDLREFAAGLRRRRERSDGL